jgi:type VI secretion system protein ImpA
MASPSVLEIEALLAPIPGDNPAGEPLPFEVRKDLDESRKEVKPESYPEDDPRRPELKRADWPRILRIGQEALTEKSKDLLVAARLTEALVKEHGFPGCRDGLQLLRRLLDDCWDRLNPVIEDGDLEVRAAPLNWLDDPDRGARFPSTLRSVPIVSANGQGYSWQYWRYAQENRPQAQIADFDKAADAAPREQCQAVMDDLDACVAELDQLTELLTAKLEGAAPALSEVRQALQDCRTLTGQILQRKGPPPEPEPAPGEEAPAGGEGEAAAEDGLDGQAGDGAAEQPAAAPRARRLATREDVYEQLREAAKRLQQIEPHSPVPFLILKAVEFGNLSFPQLMRALIRDDGVITEMNRELGIKEEQPAETPPEE